MLSALHEQAVIPVANPQAFGAVKSAIETAFSPAKVEDFLKSLKRAGLRIRDFELVLHKGLLGASTAGEYSRLGNGDRARSASSTWPAWRRSPPNCEHSS